jgi:hypothetical protein
MNSTTHLHLAGLYAHIPGDARYTDRLSVDMDRKTGEVVITVTETSAAGGMDGPGGRTEPEPSFKCVLSKDCTGKTLLQHIKTVVSNARFLFKAYGKATKKFSWEGIGAGLNVKLADEALAAAREDLTGV